MQREIVVHHQSLRSLALCVCCMWLACGPAQADSLSPRARAQTAESAAYLQIAERGVARAEHLWRNRRLGWYDSRLAAPSRAHRAAVAAFARGAERYYDATLRPMAAFAPYPGDRGQTRVSLHAGG